MWKKEKQIKRKMDLPIQLIVKVQQFEDKRIEAKASWNIKELKGKLSEIYPTVRLKIASQFPKKFHQKISKFDNICVFYVDQYQISAAITLTAYQNLLSHER